MIVDGVVYGTTPTMKLFALDGSSGNKKWIFDPYNGSYKNHGTGVNRGLNIYRDQNEDRILYATFSKLYAINAKDGKLIQSFGKQGSVDLKKGLGRQVEDMGLVVNTPGVIFKDKLILGHRTSESIGAVPGHIRAFNVYSGKIEWKLNPTYFDVALRIQDLMVLRIIKDNNWNRPVYFAVTVSPTSMLNLEEYLTMEGLAYRLSNNTSQIIDADAMTNNLLSIIGDESWFIDYNKNYNNNTNLSISKTYQPGYIYRNLANDNIYVDPQLGRLIQNYRTGFTRLAISHYLNKNFGKAEKVFKWFDRITWDRVFTQAKLHTFLSVLNKKRP